jgi:hypothetical protein
MEYKRLISVLCVLCVSIFFMAGCGTDKYADVKKVLNEYIALNDTLGKALESAKDGKAVAAALKVFVASAKTLGPTVEQLSTKYPELDTNPPAELKAIMEKMEKSNENMGTIFNKLGDYMNDEDVMKVLAELQTM